MKNLEIEAGADVNKKGKRDRTALMTAAAIGKTEAVKILPDSGADVNIEDSYGVTALLEAAFYCGVEAVKVLLNAGANINAVDKYGLTALLRAAMRGHVDIVKVLLDAGADLNAVNNDGKSALMLAKEKGNTAIVDLLKGAGAKASRRPISWTGWRQPHRMLDPRGRAAFPSDSCLSCTVVERLSAVAVEVAARLRPRLPSLDGRSCRSRLATFPSKVRRHDLCVGDRNSGASTQGSTRNLPLD